ncbi:MAG TPA: imidazolonepropionase [Candidatus Kapabacteria bacterium]|nr:imidazolonepropionase [Candidatus Kapabacteria bacterium]
MKCYRNIGQLITPTGAFARRGKAMNDIFRIDRAAILCDEGGRIIGVGSEDEVTKQLPSDSTVVDCRGLLALPGFVDSHTHAVFMGDRSDEFCMRASGKSYQEVAAAGGGIRASVDPVRSASANQIADHSERLVRNALTLGTTSMEVKSGYGLSVDAELKLLEAAKLVGGRTPVTIVRTWLGAHAIPKERTHADYVEELIYEQLPAVIKTNAAEFADVFCDEGYFTNDETEQICNAAKRAGLKIKLHADELANTGGAELAAKLGSFSADHLLKISSEGIAALARSDRTIATLLPITAMCIRSPYAPARKMIDAGCAVSIATDCNPGSSMSENMQLAVSLAVIGMGMTPEEALTAATINGAAALDRTATHGSVEIGKMADFVLYDIPSLAYLPYHIGVSDVVAVVKSGTIVSGAV